MKKIYVEFAVSVLITLLISCTSNEGILDAGNGELIIRLDKKTYSIGSDNKIIVTHENISDEGIYVFMYSAQEKTNNKWGEEKQWLVLDGLFGPRETNETWQKEIRIQIDNFEDIPGEYRIRVHYYNTFNDSLIETNSSVSPSFKVFE